MQTLIPQLYKTYGDYVCRRKMFPHMLDGLVPVWRRILLGTHVIAKSEFKKSAQIFGYVIGHWHPHSEAIQGTAELLVHNALIVGKGNWGVRIGSCTMSCAAPRYTGLKMHPFVEELAFKYIKDVPWESDELDPEPVVLPTMIPFCLFLMYGMSMIGFGFKTEIPNYKLSDLITRLLFLLGEKKKEPVIVPNIQGCTITSDKETLKTLLTTPGKCKVDLMGTYSVDKTNFRVYIHGWSPKTTFDNLFNRIDTYKQWDLISKGDVTFLDESSASVGTKIRFEVSRARNRQDIFDKLVEAVEDRLQGSITYDIYVVDEKDNIVNTCVDDMLMNTYLFYQKVISAHATRKIQETQDVVDELSVIAAIKPHLPKFLSIPDVDKIIVGLANCAKLKEEQVRDVVDKYKIRKLLTVNTDITDAKQKIADYTTQLGNINTVTTDSYKELLAKL